MKREMIGQMDDIAEPEILEVMVSADHKTIWIHDKDGCIFRACRIGQLVVPPGTKKVLKSLDRSKE